MLCILIDRNYFYFWQVFIYVFAIVHRLLPSLTIMLVNMYTCCQHHSSLNYRSVARFVRLMTYIYIYIDFSQSSYIFNLTFILTIFLFLFFVTSYFSTFRLVQVENAMPTHYVLLICKLYLVGFSVELLSAEGKYLVKKTLQALIVQTQFLYKYETKKCVGASLLVRKSSRNQTQLCCLISGGN